LETGPLFLGHTIYNAANFQHHGRRQLIDMSNLDHHKVVSDLQPGLRYWNSQSRSTFESCSSRDGKTFAKKLHLCRRITFVRTQWLATICLTIYNSSNFFGILFSSSPDLHQ
jgi:hypothetical protein